MGEDLVSVYEAWNLAEAQLLADRLEGRGIRAFLDNTDSPLDGLVAGDQTIGVRVLPADADRARPVVEGFLAERGDA